MKRAVIIALSLMLVISFSACSGGDGNTPSNKTNQSKLDELKVNDLAFTFDDAVFDGRRNASFQFANNSKYEIFHLELMMKLKDGVKIPEELKESYDEVIEWGHDVFVRVYFNQYWDSYLKDKDGYWAKDILDPVKPGETSSKIMVHRNNLYYVPDSSELENFEFEELTVRYYIDGGAYEKTVIYDYEKNKHIYGDSEPIVEAVAKPTKESEKELSEDETPIDLFKDIEIFTNVTSDNELEFWFTNNSEYTITEFNKYYRIDKKYFPKDAQEDIFVSETFSFKYNNDVKPGETSNRRLMSDYLDNAETLEKLDKNNFKYADDSDFSVRYRDGDKKYYLRYNNGKYELREM